MARRKALPWIVMGLAVCLVGLLLWVDPFGGTGDAANGKRPATAIEEIEADLLHQLRADAEARRVPGLRVRGGGVGLLRGRVVRFVQGKGLVPLAGVVVQALWHRDETEVVLEPDAERPDQRAQMETDAEGAFRFERVPAFIGGVLVVRHEPFRPILRRGVNVYRDRETDLGDLVLGAPTSLAGEVLDDKGRPLRGATIQILSDRSRAGRMDVRQLIAQLKGADSALATVTVDSAGQFVIEDLSPGRYVLRASAPGFTTAFRANVIVTLDERSSAVRIVLDPGAGFEGHVRDEAGAPIPGARLLAVLIPGSRVQRADRMDATADADGYYRIDQLVPSNRYYLHTWAPGFAPVTSLVVCGDGTKTHDVTLVASGRVEGQVVDASSGRPVAGAEVTLVTGTPIQPGPASEVTDTEGRFAFPNVRPGPIIVFSAIAPGYQQRFDVQLAGLKDRTVRSGETTIVDWALTPGGKLQGRVTTAQGRPVAHASVALVPRHRHLSELTTLTGVDGRYEVVGIAKGRYHLRVNAAGLSPIPRDDDARVDMPDELGVLTKDVVLDTGGVLHGFVLSPDEEPVSGARVFLEAKGSRAVRDRVRDLEVISSPTGSYRIVGVPPAIDLTLLAEHDAYVRTGTVPLKLGPGESREVAVTLRPGATMEVTVVDENERPVEGARIRWGHVRPEDRNRARDSFRADELLSARVVRTDVRGFAVVDGLRPGSLLVKVELEGYAAWYRHDVQVPDEGDASPLRAQLVPSMSIHGHVRSKATGQGIAKAFVYARERKGDEPDLGRVQAVVSAEADTHGHYVLGGIAPGTYEVVVWIAPGHVGELMDRRNPHVRQDARAGARAVDFQLDAPRPP